jgi:hypothetical protein
VRRKTVYTPEKHAPKAQGRIPSRLIPILMCAFLLLGLAYGLARGGNTNIAVTSIADTRLSTPFSLSVTP